MDEADMDNFDDMNELEARLYAQIHHETTNMDSAEMAIDDYQPQQPVRVVTSTSIVNNRNRQVDKTPMGRYWSEKNYHRPSNLSFTKTQKQQTPTTPPPPSITLNTGNVVNVPTRTVTDNENGGIGGGVVAISTVPKSKNLSDQVEVAEKPQRPPTPQIRVNPIASGNDPNTVGSNEKNNTPSGSAGSIEKNVVSEKTQAASSQEIEKTKNTNKPRNNKNANKQSDKTERMGPFVKNVAKLAKLIKYAEKKNKAKESRKKKTPVATIVLESSGEDDDVIEIPVPPPPTFTIDDSSDEGDLKAADEFAKPKTLDTSDKRQENTSRCTSPCSVISDDFIGQNDRSRLLNEKDVADDEDLICIQETVDTYLCSQQQLLNEANTAANDSNCFVAPNKAVEKKSSDYRVTQNNFRAIDVYESESDIQDSIYDKGKGSTGVQQQVISDSDSDIEAIDVIPKTKRFRKRRASSSNKESETNIGSTDSDEEETAEIDQTGLPFIERGEAVEHCKDKTKRKLVQNVPTSDNEFIDILNSMAKGKPEGNESEESDNYDDITARKIAEDVLMKNKNPVEELEESVIEQLEDIFDKIDHMDEPTSSVGKKSTKDAARPPCLVDEPIVDMTVAVQPATSERPNDNEHRLVLSSSFETRQNSLFYSGIYEKDQMPVGVGWNDEMIRFYNKSWNGEEFNVRSLRQSMNRNSCWKIYTQDRYPKPRHHSNLKCLNCCEFGHHRAKCPRPRKEVVCFMCGEKGHKEPRCPNTLCMRCGNKTRVFTKSCNTCTFQNRQICQICKIRGHLVDSCPDKWRRYHSTTTPNIYPVSKVTYNKRKFCCICAERGHISDHCRSAVRFLEYPASVSEIKSHQKAYDDQPMATFANGYNLHYNPSEHVSFQLAENSSKKSYYTRFLSAVNMGHLLTRKRRISTEKVDSKDKSRKLETSVKTIEIPAAEPIEIEDDDEIVEFIEIEDKSPDVVVNKDHTVDSVAEKDVTRQENVSIIAEKAEIQFKIPENTNDDNIIANKEAAGSSIEVISASSIRKETMEIDEDSNYSFSDHFGLGSSGQKKSREMEPLPDFIPLTDLNDDEMMSDSEEVGISTKFVEANSEDEEDTMSKLPEIPSEAKIYLTNFHSKFLLSPDGNKFLIEHSKKHEVQVRLDWTSVGHILIIVGLRANQDRFHTELLLMFRNLSDKLNRKQLEQSQKVPRKTTVLIRFIRENISQLQNHLGNVNDLHKRLQVCENQHTKASWKLAEKIRRLLNMIFFGQAALREGKSHLDKLLENLKSLIVCPDDNAPNKLRDEIDEHWKYIFSSYRHENYSDMLEMYNDMKSKNKLPQLVMDPLLLGKKVLDVSLTKEQKDKMENDAKQTNIKTIKHHQQDAKTLTPIKQSTQTPVKNDKKPSYVINPMSAKANKHLNSTETSRKSSPKVATNQSKVQQQSSTKSSPSVSKSNTPKSTPNTPKSSTPNTSRATTPKSASEKTYIAPKKPSSNSSFVSNKIIETNQKWDNQCNMWFNQIEDHPMGNQMRTDANSKLPSVFWSRECMKFIDECLNIGKGNQGLVEKLQRVQDKANNGLLSFNDYRAVIQIRNAIKIKH